MSSGISLLQPQFDNAWQAAAASLAMPALVVAACEDAELVRSELLSLAEAVGAMPTVLRTPELSALEPLQPLLGWWLQQGSAADRQRAVAEHFSYAPLSGLFDALARGREPVRREAPLLDDSHFERDSLQRGFARMLTQSGTEARVVLISHLENAGPALLGLLRRLAQTPCAAPLVLVLQVATQRCLSDIHFEAEWESFLEWVDTRHALVSIDAAGSPVAGAPRPAPELALARLRAAWSLLAYDEVANASREMPGDAALAWPAAVRQEIQLLGADAMLYLGLVDDALAVLEALSNELELTEDVARQSWAQRLLAYAYQLRQDFESAQLAARKAISLAEQQRDGAVHAQAWFAFYYLHDRSTLPIALADFKAMLRLLERHRLRNSLQYCLRNYYLYLRFSEEVSVSEVLRVNRQAIRLARASGHRPALAATFQTRGIIHSYRQEYAAMFRNFRISETLRTEVAEPLDLVRIRNGIGYFHTLLEQYGPAMDYYLRAFAVIRQVRDYSEILVSLFNIAWLYLVARQYRPAIELADKILAICRARRLTHFPFRNLFDVYTLKGFCHVSTGELAQARQCLERMRELPFQPSSSGEFLRVLLRGKLAMAQGDYAQAQAEFDSAPSQLNGQTTSGSDDRMLPQCELELAQLKCHQGDTAAAIDHLNRARALCETRAMPLSLRRVQDAIRQLAQHGGLLVEPPPEPLPACELALDDLVAMAQLQTRLDEARKRLREVNLLSRVQRMVDQHDSMERLAEVALRFVAANLSARAASLLRQVDGAWVPLARFGDATDAAALAQVLPRLQQTGTMLIENRLHREGEIGTRASYRSLVGLPMLEEGRVTGALLLSTHDSGRYFDRHDREVLGLLAAQLGSQFAQLAHRERLVRMSTTDTLTGLANRQALQVRLHEDMRAHAGAPVHCALAFVDLDNFKYVNDTFGHAAGDAVLQHFAQLLRRCLRDKDLAARWGGDEFVIFCPGTSAAKARLVADRLLAALDAAQRFAPLLAELCGAPAHFPPDKMLGCSIGIAEALLGPSGVDDQELLRRADSALYRAKALGKGQVEEWKAADDEPVRQ